MQPKLVWSALRLGLKPMLIEAGLKRLKSSPPAYSMVLPDGDHLTLWFKMRSAGGGQFIGAMQRASQPRPGIEWTGSPSFASERLPDLFDAAVWERARALHADVERRVGGGAGREIGPGQDYWFAFEDAGDVTAWAELLGEHLSEWAARVAASPR